MDVSILCRYTVEDLNPLLQLGDDPGILVDARCGQVVTGEVKRVDSGLLTSISLLRVLISSGGIPPQTVQYLSCFSPLIVRLLFPGS